MSKKDCENALPHPTQNPKSKIQNPKSPWQPPPCLEVRDLWFEYDDGPAALRGLSLQIAEGELVAFIGQNGSGKTTLAKHFNGLLRPTRGQVWLHGQTIDDRPVSHLAHSVGYVFQNPDHQIFNPTVREEIAVGPRNLGLSEAEVAQRVAEAMAALDLEPYADRQPAILSFGLRRKVSLAAVLAMRTPILILDEPTAGLDRKSTTELMTQIQARHQQGQTIILITHDMGLVAEYVPRCLILQAGQLLAQGSPRQIFRLVDLLQQTDLDLPQITALARRLAPYGLPEDILTVAEFCRIYLEQVK